MAWGIEVEWADRGRVRRGMGKFGEREVAWAVREKSAWGDSRRDEWHGEIGGEINGMGS